MDKVRIIRALRGTSALLVVTISFLLVTNRLQGIRTVDVLQILGVGMLLGVLIQNLFLYFRLPASDAAAKGKA
ncbi:hypothetical protein BH24BAC1_BH24BAC1_13830 [soil metagenome]|jgi:hypothetical protein